MMKKMMMQLMLLWLLGSANSLLAQTSCKNLEIATWYNFRSCAISYTFDDGLQSQLDVAMPLFDKYGYRATLFVMGSDEMSWNSLRSLDAKGFEIASHTVSHPNLSELSYEKQVGELKHSYQLIKKQIGRAGGMTFAFPYCATCSDSLTASFYFAARICSNQIESKTPRNFMRISSIPCGAESKVNSVEAFGNLADSAAKLGGWNIYLLHAVDDAKGYSSLSSVVLEKSLAYLKKDPHRFWVDTFGNVAKYIKERDAALVNEAFIGNRKVVLELTDKLDDEIFDHPLTVRYRLPLGWRMVQASQGASPLQVKAKKGLDGKLYVVFNAVPDRGPISLVRTR